VKEGKVISLYFDGKKKEEKKGEEEGKIYAEQFRLPIFSPLWIKRGLDVDFQ